MTVKELIEQLEEIDPNLEIRLSGSGALVDVQWHWNFLVQPHQIVITQ